MCIELDGITVVFKRWQQIAIHRSNMGEPLLNSGADPRLTPLFQTIVTYLIVLNVDSL